MPDAIKCGVYNCLYNREGRCRAEAIEVSGKESGSIESSLGTFCETFRDADTPGY